MSSSLEHALAGSAGAVLSSFLLYPLDRWKTMTQVSRGKGSKRTGSLQVLSDLLRDEGCFGVWGGCLPMLQTVGISVFVYFYLFEATKRKLKFLQALKARPRALVLMASSLAGALNMVITEPLWRASVVLQTQGGGESSVLNAVVRMWRSEGPGALWRGLALSLWLVCNPVIQFFSYDILKELLPKLRVKKRQNISGLEAFTIGAMAKAVATVLSFPLIVAQSRLRAQESLLNRDEDESKLPLLKMSSAPDLPRRMSLTAMQQEVVDTECGSVFLQIVNKMRTSTDPMRPSSPSSRTNPDKRLQCNGVVAPGVDNGLDQRRSSAPQILSSRLKRVRSSSGMPETLGMITCLRQLWREHGIQGLYLGLVPKLSQTVLTAAFMFMFYEQILRIISKIVSAGHLKRLQS